MPIFEISGGVDPLLSVRLAQGEKILAESNAMVAMDGTLSLKGKSRGGIMKSLARKVLNDETFFQQEIQAKDADGQVLLAPNIPGDICIFDVGERQYRLADGAFLACTDQVELQTTTQKLGNALLGSSGGLFVIKTQGHGQIAVGGFGSIRCLAVKPGQTMLVDNGHLVAWDDALEYELTLNTAKSGLFGKIVHSQTTGEGIVLKFRGEGNIYVCSRNQGGFIEWILNSKNTDKAPKND